MKDDDASWKSGKAPLGYGEKSGITTEIEFGGDEKNKRMSYYFRNEFELDDTDFETLTLSYQVDDGCAIFLNGKSVARHSLPKRPDIAHDTPATKIAGGAAETKLHTREIGTDKLRKGRNTIAVQVHQIKPDSSDLRLELELSAVR